MCVQNSKLLGDFANFYENGSDKFKLIISFLFHKHYYKFVDRQLFEMEQEEWEAIFKQAEREAKERRRRAEAERRNRKPTRAKLIEFEKQRLLNKITMLEEKPSNHC